MKLAFIVLPGLLVLAGVYHGIGSACATESWHGESSIGVLRTKGGSLIAVQTPQGVKSDCKLPSNGK